MKIRIKEYPRTLERPYDDHCNAPLQYGQLHTVRPLQSLQTTAWFWIWWTINTSLFASSNYCTWNVQASKHWGVWWKRLNTLTRNCSNTFSSTSFKIYCFHKAHYVKKMNRPTFTWLRAVRNAQPQQQKAWGKENEESAGAAEVWQNPVVSLLRFCFWHSLALHTLEIQIIRLTLKSKCVLATGNACGLSSLDIGFWPRNSVAVSKIFSPFI